MTIRKKFLGVLAALAAFMPAGVAQAQTQFSSGISAKYDGHTRISEYDPLTRAEFEYHCIHPHSAYSERECMFRDHRFIVTCGTYETWDYDDSNNNTSEFRCEWQMAPGYTTSPIVVEAGNDLVASLARGGHHFLPTASAPAGGGATTHPDQPNTC